MKKQIFAIFMIIILFLINFSGCTKEEDANSNSLSSLDWSNSEYGIGLNYPDGWTVNNNDAYGAIVRFNGKTDSGVTPNIGITGPSQLENNQTLSEAVDEVIVTYQDILTDFSLISSKSKLVNNMDGWEILYTFTQGTVNLKQKQVLVVKETLTYVITLSAPNNSVFNTYDALFEQSVSSFTIL